jgi:hypothetical protein
VLPNANVRFAKWTSGTMGANYLTRMEITLDQNQPPAQDPIAAQAYGDFQEVTTVTKTVRVPVEVTCNDGCCNDCNAKPKTRFDWLSVLAAVAFVLRPRRRRRRRSPDGETRAA